jgi:hypothetical protein
MIRQRAFWMTPVLAAAMLKINPHTLRATMRKLDIDWARFRPS